MERQHVIRVVADHIIRSARLQLHIEDFRRMILILQHWNRGIIRRSVAEYMIKNITKSCDGLGREVALYFHYCNNGFETRRGGCIGM